MALHDGDVLRSERKDEDGQYATIATVARAANGAAMIPGSSMKGAIRAWLERHEIDARLIEGVFGREAKPKRAGSHTTDQGQGGKFEFGFGYSPAGTTLDDEQSVAIDRVTRAASDRLLFARQVVPSGTVFEVEVLGFQVSEAELAALLVGFEAFNEPANDSDERVRLGSGTNNDYGLATWKLLQADALDATEINAWLDNGANDSPWLAARTITERQLPNVRVVRRPRFGVDLKLDFSGWFLTKDPKRSKPKGNAASTDLEDRLPDAFPVLDAEGRIVLRPRGFRGAFRSQAERIARTLCEDAGGDPNRDAPEGCSRIIEALFGDTSQRAAVRCSSFVDSRASWDGSGGDAIPDDVRRGERTALLKREFVAIDRFTGGAAEHLKFDCVAAWRPQLQGSISIDLDRLATRCERSTPAAALGLLLLTLRDLCDGDVAFGFGWGKGFGECRASITSFQLEDPHSLAGDWQLADEYATALETERTRSAAEPFDKFTPEQRALATVCVRAARKHLQQPQSVVMP
ncbi:MAG: hypothetical protein KDA38_13130 [Planctomycetales bacterium]|nr:hypothetical protein [Planctomycetales bacterium]